MSRFQDYVTSTAFNLQLSRHTKDGMKRMAWHDHPQHKRNKHGMARRRNSQSEGKMIHWTASRKARLIRAIEDCEFTDMDAFILYGITGPELDEWRKNYEQYGLRGLKITKAKKKTP